MKRRNATIPSLLLIGMIQAWIAPGATFAQAVEVVKVTAATSERAVLLPGELTPYEAVNVVARVPGYIERMQVDRGSAVRRGQVLATIIAPELAAQVAEARARVAAATAKRVEAESASASARLTYERLKTAAATTGAVAGVELLHAEEAMKGAAALVDSSARAVDAANASLQAVQVLEGYLRVVAPFAGTVTERLVHEGALVGPSAGPLLRLEQTSRLRLVLPVPEKEYRGVATNRTLQFTVPAQPGRMFTGRVSRIAGSLDTKTRAMAVELDVDNKDAALAPGMYPEVSWPVAAASGAFLVPPTAVVSTTERTFVIRVKGDKAEWVTVKRGPVRGDVVEVSGPLTAGDTVLKRGSDEVRDGATVAVKPD
jgi:membrane fusion protein, multidrug efflux system